jgi:hypothetical protein
MKIYSKKITSLALIIALIAGFWVPLPKEKALADGEDWYNPSWSKRIKITIDADKVDSDLTDFPVYVDLNDLGSDFFTHVKADGGDIRVTKADGTTEVPREVVVIDTGADTGELHFKADGTLSASVDTEFYIYYGNSGASDYATDATYGAENVWTEYLGVWHLDEAVNTNTDGYKNSASDNHHGTGVSMALTEDDAVLGKGQEFDGVSDYIDMGTSLNGLFGKSITLTQWVRGGEYGTFYAANTNGSSYSFGMYKSAMTGLPYFYTGNGGVAGSPTVMPAGWNYLAGTADGSTVRVFVNGVEKASSGNTSNIAQSYSFNLMRGWANNRNSGEVDEVRIASSDLGSDWISAEYANQSSPDTFYEVGEQETRYIWYNPSWSKRIKITIDADKVDSDLTDFPVYVDLNDLGSDFFTHVKADGGDIRVTKADGTTEVPREVVVIDTGAETGELHFKADGTLSASVDTEFYIYYGNSRASDYATDATYGAENVWDDDFVAVLHMAEDPTGTILDSTSNSADFSGVGMESGDLVTGAFGSALDFDSGIDTGANEYLLSDSESKFDAVETANAVTITAYAQPVTDGISSPNFRTLYSRGSDPSDTSISFVQNRTNQDIEAEFNFSRYTVAQTLTNSSWYHLALVLDGTTEEQIFYTNGSVSGAAGSTAFNLPTSNADIYIGGDGADRGWRGLIDELRVSKVQRSADWISAEYANQSSPDTFYGVGEQETRWVGEQDWYNPSWSKRIKITIDADKVDSDLTDFPVYVDLNDLGSDFFTHVKADGGDIRVTKADGTTEVPREVVVIDTGAETGELHFKADGTLSASVDTEFYIYYGNSRASDYATDATYGAENVWDDDFVAVLHMAEDPTGTILDSTSNSADFSGVGMESGDLVTGAFGSALDFDSGIDTGANEYLLSDSESKFDAVETANAVTITAYAQPVTDGISSPNFRTLYSRGSDPSDTSISFVQNRTNQDIEAEFNFSRYTVAQTLTNSSWYHLALVLDGTTEEQIFYTNGSVSGAAGSTAFNLPTSNADIYIGGDGADRGWRGLIDELRVSKVQRSADWISAEYANQSSPDTFYEVGEQETRYIWYNTSWSKRIKITIDADKVDSDLIDFPVYVDMSTLPIDFFEQVRFDGGDIRMTKYDGLTELPREIVSIDTGKRTGELHFKAEFLSSIENTVFYLYYNNPNVTDYATDATYGAENVWDDDFVLVSHDGGGMDSTSNGNDGTGYGTDIDVGADVGKIGSATEFNGTDDYIVTTKDPGDLGLTTKVTVSAFVNFDVLANARIVSNVDFGQNKRSVDFAYLDSGYISPNGGLRMQISDDGNSFSVAQYDFDATLSTGSFNQLVTVYDKSKTSNNRITAYRNGNALSVDSVDKDAEEDIYDNGLPFVVGATRSNAVYSGFLNGIIDEIRISSIARSADWISAEYANQNDPGTFYAVGDEESLSSWYDNGWTRRIKITIDADKIDSDLTDFPVYVDMSTLPNDFFEQVRFDGGDIRMTKYDGVTELPREVVSIDTSAQTGELHFKADTLYADDDTSFYLYYRNKLVSEYPPDATYGAENVWDDDFVFVSHDGGGSDSTSNGNDSTGGNVTAGNAAGVVGAATDYSGTGTYRQLPSGILNGVGDRTISAFVKYDGSDGAIVSQYDSPQLEDSTLFWVDAQSGMSPTSETNTLTYLTGVPGTGIWVNGPSNMFTTGQTYHVAAVHDVGSSVVLYKDGAAVVNAYEDNETMATTGATETTYVGYSPAGSHDHTDIIDEIRISSIARSAEWIATEYENQNSPGTFYAVGAQKGGGSDSFNAQTWNSKEWTQHVKITIDADKIDSDLTDFPVYVDMSTLPNEFFSGVRSDGGDIRMVKNDLTTELPREVVSIDTSGQTGELHFKADFISSTTDTVFYLYYGNANANDYNEYEPYGAWNAWNDGYKGVWHLGELTDSTKYNYDLSTYGSATTEANGNAGTARAFDGTSYLYHDSAITSYPITLSTFVKFDTAITEDSHIIGQYNSKDDLDYIVAYGNHPERQWNAIVRDSDGNNANIANYGSTDTNWNRIVLVVESDQIHLYKDGQFLKSTNNSPTVDISNLNNITLGGKQTTANIVSLNGIIDEARRYAGVLSDAWIAAEFENLNDAATFYTAEIDTSEPQPEADWSKRIKITIDADNIDNDLTDFPVYVDMSTLPNEFFSGVRSDGGDIRMVKDDLATELPREVVSIDTSGQTGELHFKADFISSTTDTTFYLYYNNPNATDYATDDTYGAENVWSNGYVGVWHMDSVNPTDSSQYGKDGAQVGSLGLDSFMGAALDFDNTDYVDLQDNFSELAGESELTISTWVNLDPDATDDWIFSSGRTDTTTPIVMWDNIVGTTNDDTFTFLVGSSSLDNNRVDGAENAAQDSVWQHVVGSMDGSARYLYVDGSLSNSNSGAVNAVVPSQSSNAAIGTFNSGYFGGSMDEFRISSTTRSAAWIAAEYANQNDPSAFYSIDQKINITGMDHISNIFEILF